MTHDHGVTERVERERTYVRDATPRERIVVDPGPSPAEMLRRIVILVFGILQSLLVIRIILLLLIANPGNDVVAFVLTVTDPFVEPFRGMFQLDRVTDDSGAMLDVAAIVALIAWTLVEALILAIVNLAGRRSEDVVA